MAIEARCGGLKLRHAVVDKVLSCSRRTKDSTSSLVIKIVFFLATLTGHRAVDRLSAYE